ncbi:cytosine permease [Nonomuraea sp. NPDC049158]|uniref:cytosine permease n=1 Tax=Nonomuraea sp. NPDC049158 TaxID=3155649 RepID=UPI0033CC70F9
MDMMTVEQNGINAVPAAERRGTPRDLLWPWAGANLSLFGVAFGVYVVGLGLGVFPAIITAVIGYALSFGLVGLVAIAGTFGAANIGVVVALVLAGVLYFAISSLVPRRSG